MQPQPPQPPQPPRYQQNTQRAYPPRQTQSAMPRPVQVIDQSTARLLSAVAHAAIAFGLLGVGFLVTLAISGVIWLYARRSPLVRFHSEQAGCYQCSVLLINVVLVVIMGLAGGFSIFTTAQGRSDWGVGWVFWVLLVFFAVWFIATIVLGVVGAILVLMGKPFKYPVIGDRFLPKQG